MREVRDTNFHRFCHSAPCPSPCNACFYGGANKNRRNFQTEIETEANKWSKFGPPLHRDGLWHGGAFEWPMMNLRPVQLVVKIVLLAETSAAMSINPSIIIGRVFAAHATHLTDGEKGSDQKQLERVLSDRL